jgi:hypothetical protein
MDAIFDKALNSDLPEADKIELARRRMDMCDKYAPDIDRYWFRRCSANCPLCGFDAQKLHSFE